MFWITVKAQALGSRHYQHSCKAFGALLTNIYTRHAEQLLAGQSGALVVWLYRQSWTMRLRIMVIVLYGETIAKPSGLEIARVGLIPGYWDFTIAQDQTGSLLVGKSRFTIESPDMGRCASA